MREAGRSRESRHAIALGAALLWAALLVAAAPAARSDPAEEIPIDRDPEGAPYVAGELLIAYKDGVSGERKDAAVREFEAETLDDLPHQAARLISFPEIESLESVEERQEQLEKRREALERDPRVAAVDYNYVYRFDFIPRDPKFGNQWGFTRAGFPEAWDRARGRGVKIALIDSGVAARHPDIGKIALQRDFASNDPVAEDRIGHGTHVAGTTAALTNNRRGIAGGCPGCRLMVAKISNRDVITTANVVKAVRWSANHGADVINMSFGGPGKSKILGRAVTYAWRKGAVVVAAAGNDGNTRRQYPAAYPAAIAVSATSRGDRLARFSSRGRWVDLAAPGIDILSTFTGRRYRAFSGTSMAAPHVSALAGLLASRDLTAPQIRKRMERTAKDLGPRGRDPRYGYGRIDAARALR